MTDVVGWRIDDVVDQIRGAKDTHVRLDMLPADAGLDGKHATIALVRKKVSIEEQAGQEDRSSRSRTATPRATSA